MARQPASPRAHSVSKCSHVLLLDGDTRDTCVHIYLGPIPGTNTRVARKGVAVPTDSADGVITASHL